MIPLHAAPPRPVGVHAVGIAVAVLSRLNYQVASPHDPTLPFDLLACRDGELRLWFKIQVKGTDSSGWVSLRRGTKRRGCKRYVAGDFDYLLAVDDASGVYLVPYAAIQHCRSRVCLRTSAMAAYRVSAPLGHVAVSVSSSSRQRIVLEELPLFREEGLSLVVA